MMCEGCPDDARTVQTTYDEYDRVLVHDNRLRAHGGADVHPRAQLVEHAAAVGAQSTTNARAPPRWSTSAAETSAPAAAASSNRSSSAHSVGRASAAVGRTTDRCYMSDSGESVSSDE